MENILGFFQKVIHKIILTLTPLLGIYSNKYICIEVPNSGIDSSHIMLELLIFKSNISVSFE